VLALGVLCAAVGAGAASSAPVVSVVSGPSPFPLGCEGVAQSGTLYQNAEVEPRVAVDPNDPTHIVGVWQQDRWSNGGAHGPVAAASFDGGTSWTRSFAP
jgi:hypothetical protein